MAQPYIGGQAVIEGVMMRAPNGWAVAVRRPDEVIETQSNELPRLSARSSWAKVPFIRGVLVLVESLSLGFRALSWSGLMILKRWEGRLCESPLTKPSPGALGRTAGAL